MTKKLLLIIFITIAIALIVIKITAFIINSNNQELIYHIHYFDQSKTKKYCLFHRFLCYDLYFESYSSNDSNIFYSTKLLRIRCYLLSQQHFYSHLLVFYAHYYYLLNTNKSLALIQQILKSQHRLFHLSFCQPLICLNYHNILT